MQGGAECPSRRLGPFFAPVRRGAAFRGVVLRGDRVEVVWRAIDQAPVLSGIEEVYIV